MFRYALRLFEDAFLVNRRSGKWVQRGEGIRSIEFFILSSFWQDGVLLCGLANGVACVVISAIFPTH